VAADDRDQGVHQGSGHTPPDIPTLSALTRRQLPAKIAVIVIRMSDVTPNLDPIEHPHAAANLHPIVYKQLRSLAAQKISRTPVQG
jgi:hypothetical protein